MFVSAFTSSCCKPVPLASLNQVDGNGDQSKAHEEQKTQLSDSLLSEFVGREENESRDPAIGDTAPPSQSVHNERCNCVDATTDRFLYFSSTKRRHEYLLGRELPHMKTHEPTTRKTRISFELDPTYCIISSYPELFEELESGESESPF